MIDCLLNVVGITEQVCPCLGDNPDAAIKPYSDFYLDDMQLGIPLHWPKNAIDCGEDSIWDLCKKAIKEGAIDFELQMHNYISEYNDVTIRPSFDEIGKLKNNTALAELLGNNVGLIIESGNFKGVYFKIKGSAVHVNSPIPDSTVDLKFYDLDDITEPVKIVTVPLPGGQYNKEYFTLPMTDMRGPKSYAVTYDPSGLTPLNNKLDCGCGGNARDWHRFINASGFNEIDFSNVAYNSSNELAYGIRLDVEITCDNIDWLCIDPSFWKTNKYYRSAAKCLQMFQIGRLINYVLKSGNINRYTLLEREALYGRRNHLKAEAEKYLGYLGKNVPLETTNCFVCRPSALMAKSSIRV